MTPLPFGKNLRLLTSKDFQRVFDHNIWRASHKHLLVLAAPNDQGHPRLGLVIAKKHVKRAVGRNRLKRLIRESFRLNQEKLPAADFVVLIRPGIGDLDNPAVVELLQRSWRKVRRKAETGPNK